MALQSIFDERQCRTLLLAIHQLSKTQQLNPPISMKTIVKLHPSRDETEILSYHQRQDYIDFIEENTDREYRVAKLLTVLWEPYNKKSVNQKRSHVLERLRLLRNRYAHALTETPENTRGFIHELKTAHWEPEEWAEFVLECLQSMNEEVPVNPRILLRDALDFFNAASQEQQKLDHHRTDLHSTIDFLTSDDEWSQYIGVLDERGKVAIDRLIELLDPEKAKYVIQICGEGGLGKTALMREYIRRNITEGASNELYDNYLILSSKSKVQGEVNTLPSKEPGFQTTAPVYPKQGPFRYSEGLNFLEFKRIIAAHALEDSTDIAVIQRAIHDNRFLIVLDNFEDCSDEDRSQYIDLFDSLKAGCSSRIIITGRKEASADDIPTIRLGYLSSEAASRLLIARYLYLQEKHSSTGIWEFRNSIYNALDDLRQVDFIESLNSSMLIEKDEGSDQLDPAVFRDRIGHPLVILRLAVEMGRPDLPLMYDNEPDSKLRLIRLLTHIAKDNNFISWQQEVSKWVTDKAYEDIATHPECVLILFRLLDGMATLGELKAHVNEQQGVVEKVPEAIRRLESHQILIRLRNDGRYEAAEQAKSHIHHSVQSEETKTQETSKVADGIEETLDAILRNMANNGDPAARHALIHELVSAETPLHRRKSITNHSYILIDNILAQTSFEASDVELLLAQSFAELGSTRLAQQNGFGEPTRKAVSKILIRSLCSFRADAPTIHRLTRNLSVDDIALTNPNTQTLFSRLILRAIQQIPDLYPIYLADTISILAASGANSNILISELKNAWLRINSHPNVQHGQFDEAVKSQARKLLFRMAQNDEEWETKTANLLNLYQAEDERPHWDDVLKWPKYALPPTAPTSDVLNHLIIPETFSPGVNGLSFDRATGEMAVFKVVENPILNEAVVSDEFWPPEDCIIFEMKVKEWFTKKIVERPNGFPATDMTNFISVNYGRTKEVIPKASQGKFLGWMSWFEEVILSQPEFDSYYLDRPTGKHVVIARNNSTENPKHWLFDDTSGHAPKLPQPLHIYDMLVALSLGKKVAHNLHQIHNKFLGGYLNYLKVSNKLPSELDLLSHLKEVRNYIHQLMQLTEFSEKMVQGIMKQIDVWRSQVLQIQEKRGKLIIQPIRRRRLGRQEEE